MNHQPLLSAETLSKLAVKQLGYQAIPVTDRKSWLAMRHEDVTASAAGCLLGVHEYMTPFALYMVKSEVSPDAEENAAMRRGRLLEPVALQLLAEEQPTWHIERGVTYYRDPLRRLGATPDALAIDPARRGFGVVQFKSVEASAFRRKWRGADGEIEPPLWIAVQAILEAELTGASWAVVAPLVVGFGIDIQAIEIPLHPGILARLRDATADFWRAIETLSPPNPDFSRDGEALAAMYGQDDGTTIDLSGSNSILALADEDGVLSGEIKIREARRKEIKAEVIAALGTHAIGMIDGRVVVATKTVHRKGYVAEPTSYRSVRFAKTLKGDSHAGF